MWLKKKLIIFSSAFGKQFFYWETKLVRHDAVLFFEAYHMVTMMSQVKCVQTVQKVALNTISRIMHVFYFLKTYSLLFHQLQKQK